MTNQVGPGLAKPAYGSELRARDRNEVRVSGFHRGPQRNYRLQQGRIESCSPSCQSDHAKAVAKRDAFIEIGMEACGSAHYWARKRHGMGHTVRLIAPQFVKPYVKTNKNDAADAEAICEAVSRPSMRFVPIKSVEQACRVDGSTAPGRGALI